MTKQRKSHDKAPVDVKDLGAKKNPKGGAPSVSEITIKKETDASSSTLMTNK